MKIKEIIKIVEGYAPLELQADFDNSGMQVCFEEDDVRGVLLCVDVTPAVIDEAVSKGANMVISHHPVLFHPVKKIVAGGFISDIILKAAAARVSIYSAHTNLDCVLGGLNDFLAGALGIDVDIERAGEGEYYRIGTVHGSLTFGQFAANVERAVGAKVRTIGNKDKVVAAALVSTGAGGGESDRRSEQGDRHGFGEQRRGRRRQGDVRNVRARRRGRGDNGGSQARRGGRVRRGGTLRDRAHPLRQRKMRQEHIGGTARQQGRGLPVCKRAKPL